MDRKKFLDTIRMIETSGGTNLEHPEIKTGAYKGQTAIGEYGILPPTLKEFLNRRKFSGTYGPDEAIMSQMSDEQLKQLLESQDRIEQNLAQDIAERVLTRSKEDPVKAAYMWNQGHNLPLERITQKKLDKTDYDDKFKQYSEELAKKNRDEQFKKLKEMVKNYTTNRQIASESEE